MTVNSSPSEKNGHHFAGEIFKDTFMIEKVCILIQEPPKFAPIHNKSALVPVMAWRRKGEKSLPEPILTEFTDANKRH